MANPVGRPPGTPRTGGRQKGTANKRTNELANLLRERFPDYDPVIAMAAIARDDDVELHHRITCHREVAQYLHAKRKFIEVETETSSKPIEQMTDDEVREAVALLEEAERRGV